MILMQLRECFSKETLVINVILLQQVNQRSSPIKQSYNTNTLKMNQSPCALAVSCLQCVQVGNIYVELASNSSFCCFKSPGDIMEPFTWATTSESDCPQDAASHAAVAGIVTGVLMLLLIVFLVGWFWKWICLRFHGYETAEEADDESDTSGVDEEYTTTEDEDEQEEE